MSSVPDRRASGTDPLASLYDLRFSVAKEWLARVIQASSLDETAGLRTNRLLHEGAELVAAIAEELAGPDTRERPTPRVPLAWRADPRPAEMAKDLAELQVAVIHALHGTLADGDPRLLLTALERLSAFLGEVQTTAFERLLKTRLRDLEFIANSDPLTGLFNTRFFRQHIRHLERMHARYSRPFSVLMLDVDGMKAINDALGHAAGDRLLRAVAGRLKENTRAADAAFRLGGDEFCVLTPEDSRSTEVAARRIMAAFEAIDVADGGFVSVSMGLVGCPEHATDADELVKLADAAMYRAKRDGGGLEVGVPAEAIASAS